MVRQNSKIYQTLYPQQRVFIDELVDNRSALKNPDEVFKWGFFLKMGFGKTKLLVTMAELHGADLVMVVSDKNKMLERENEGEFPAELATAGYETFYSDKMGSVKYERAFMQALQEGRKVAYMFNWEQFTARKGYAILNWIVGGLDSLKARDRKAYIENESAKSNIPADELGPNRGKGFNKIVWLMDEAHALNNKDSAVSKLFYKMFYGQRVPGLQVSRDNYFKRRSCALYLATGTPMTGKYYENYFWLLKILGHNWGLTPVRVKLYENQLKFDTDVNGNVIGRIEQEENIGVGSPPSLEPRFVYNPRAFKQEYRLPSEYEYFLDRYCVMVNDFDRRGEGIQRIESFKRIPELLDIVEQYAFFGETSKHLGLPPVYLEVKWIPPGYGYREMTNRNSPTYQTFDNRIMANAAEFYLRARQLLSGFMGNAKDFKYYNYERAEALARMLVRERDNYIIFYHWEPELYAIIDALQRADYKYDIYKGELKEYETYRQYESGTGHAIVANIASGARTLNRQKWNSVIFYSLPSVYAQYEQAVGRVHRTGQKADGVFITVFLAKSTVDEKVFRALNKGENYTEESFARDFLTQKGEGST